LRHLFWKKEGVYKGFGWERHGNQVSQSPKPQNLNFIAYIPLISIEFSQHPFLESGGLF
jgi:hypothetical protein